MKSQIYVAPLYVIEALKWKNGFQPEHLLAKWEVNQRMQAARGMRWLADTEMKAKERFEALQWARFFEGKDCTAAQ